MHTNFINLLGAGGHCRVVIDTLLLLGYQKDIIQTYDDREELHDTLTLGCRIKSPIPSLNGFEGYVHAAVGSGETRQQLLQTTGLPNHQWMTIIHPRSSLSSSAEVGSGCFIAAMSHIGPCTQLAVGVIVNHGAVVDHDCLIGSYSHIAPLASLGGGVTVGQRVLIGAGARVLPGLSIGDDVIVGAGAVVLSDIPSNQTWAGLPARFIEKRNK